MDLILDYVRTRPGATELRSSYFPGDDGPAGFYRTYGFVETGELEDDVEVVISLDLNPQPGDPLIGFDPEETSARRGL